ncbi:hypothetical protein H5410_045305 [Solanum commersonii]|uniref:Uncharacterized protein n=1 Tax=Solanum commersonii TaxID=4109 RepID=A0A9J5XB71_SOLCO|nr:hypothetical protein H5410_045305 [Solanum commersonii]
MPDKDCPLDLTLTEGPVKLGEPSDHSACHRVDWRGVAGLNSRRWIENGHVEPYGELGQACRTTRRFAK